MSKFKLGDRVVPKPGALNADQQKRFEQKCIMGGYMIVTRLGQTIICADRNGDSLFYSPKDMLPWYRELNSITNLPVYYTLPAPTAETEIDYKKAFDLILEHYGHGGSKFSCQLCKALEIHCLSSGECNDKIIAAIKRKCTKGGE